MPLLAQQDTSNGQVLVNGKWVQKYRTNYYNSVDIHNNGVYDGKKNVLTAAGFNNSLYTMGLLEYMDHVVLGNGNLTWDPGWCGGVASAMAFKAYAVAHNITSSYLGSTNVNYFISQSFVTVGTSNVPGGGTSDIGVLRGYQAVASLAGGSASNIGRSIPSISNYMKTMPIVTMSVQGYNKAGAYGSHFLTLNGVNGPYYVMYDPWGDVYNASIANGFLTWDNVTFNNIKSDNGMPKSYGYIGGVEYNTVSIITASMFNPISSGSGGGHNGGGGGGVPQSINLNPRMHIEEN